MAGVGDLESPFAGKVRHDARGETVRGELRQKEGVQPIQRLDRMQGARRPAGQSLLQLLLDHRHEHGGGQPLAGDVAERQPEPPSVAAHQVEIAREPAGRPGEGGHIRPPLRGGVRRIRRAASF